MSTWDPTQRAMGAKSPALVKRPAIVLPARRNPATGSSMTLQQMTIPYFISFDDPLDY
jgi:hypothetical protein